ncbi:hypothetical protein ACFLR7_04345 [Acidobacteriota bacterium]
MDKKRRVFELWKNEFERLVFTISGDEGDKLIEVQAWEVLGEDRHDWHPTSERISFSADLIRELKDGLRLLVWALKN